MFPFLVPSMRLSRATLLASICGVVEVSKLVSAIRRRDFKFYYYCSMSTTERTVIHNIVRSQGSISITENAKTQKMWTLAVESMIGAHEPHFSTTTVPTVVVHPTQCCFGTETHRVGRPEWTRQNLAEYTELLFGCGTSCIESSRCIPFNIFQTPPGEKWIHVVAGTVV
jgi:hypothetical protein